MWVWVSSLSYDVSLSIKDYTNIVKWFELAFGKQNDATTEDRSTFTKLSAMAMALAEDERKLLEDENEE